MDNIEKLMQICQELISFINDEFTAKWQGEKLESFLEKIVYFLFRRNYKTFLALHLLCVNNYGQDALALARSIFECYINLAYIKQDDSENRAELFSSYGLLAKRKGIKKGIEEGFSSADSLEKFDYKNNVQLDRVKTLIILEAKRLKDQDASFGGNEDQGSGLSIKRMEAIVGLDKIYHGGPYNMSSNQIHSNGNSADAYIDIDGKFMSKRANDEAIANSLVFGCEFFLQTIDLVNNILNLGFDEKLEELKNKCLSIKWE